MCKFVKIFSCHFLICTSLCRQSDSHFLNMNIIYLNQQNKNCFFDEIMLSRNLNFLNCFKNMQSHKLLHWKWIQVLKNNLIFIFFSLFHFHFHFHNNNSYFLHQLYNLMIHFFISLMCHGICMEEVYFNSVECIGWVDHGA